MSNVVTINLLDESQPDEVILLDDDVEHNVAHEFIFKENKHLSKIFQMCLKTSNSKAMMRIFNRMIIPTYKEVDKSYRQSARFNKVLKHTIQLLENDPVHKYSHMKCLYEVLKMYKVRKKVELVTLETNIKGKEATKNGKRKPDSICNNINKKAKIDIINLDTYEPSVIIVDDVSDVLNCDNVYQNDANKNNTENPILDCTNTLETMSSNHINFNSSEIIRNDEINPEILENNQENTLLIPKSDEVCNEDCQGFDARLFTLEKTMENYRRRIAELEEQEVDDDTVTSPYIVCEKYKHALVQLYNKWCKLMGQKAIKSKKIRLNVQEGHPPGPVRRLETFLNNNIGSDGCPLFPDLQDVLQCVLVSNKEDGLSWNKARIMSEALALFSQCGRALQKRRQIREWHDLMLKVKHEEFGKDPADDDPELEARLQENRRIASIKEAKILQKFSLMQDLQSKDKTNGVPSTSIPPQADKDSMVGSNDCTNIKEAGNTSDLLKADVISDADNNVEVKIKQERTIVNIMELLETLGDNYTATIQDIEDPFLVVEISDSSDEE